MSTPLSGNVTFLAAAADQAERVNPVFWGIAAVSVFCLALITAAMIYFVVRYRRRGSEVGVHIEGHLGLEVLWTVVPTIIVMGMFWFGWKGFEAMRKIPDDALIVKVYAAQWSWDYRYIERDEGGKSKEVISRSSKNREPLIVPVGRPVKLELESSDVIHSYYVPAFRIKEDAVPGVPTYLTFTATETDPEKGRRYDVFCAEYCGAASEPLRDPKTGKVVEWPGHHSMYSEIWVVPQDRFDLWYRCRGKIPMEVLLGIPYLDAGEDHPGLQVLKGRQCLSCHRLDGTDDRAPTFRGLYGRKTMVIQKDGSTHERIADDRHIRESVLHPDAEVVEAYRDQPGHMQVPKLGEDEITAIIEFLKGLK